MKDKSDSRKIDEAFKKFLEDPNVCADIANAVLFHGENVIQAGSIVLVNTEQIDDTLQVGRRDVIFEIHMKGVDTYRVCLMGVEEQTTEDHTMPARAMYYDSVRYMSQITTYENQNIAGKKKRKWKKSNAINLTVTVVVNMSGRKWRSPISMYEMAHFKNNELSQVFSNHHYVLIDPYDKKQGWEKILKGEMGLLCQILMHARNESLDGERREL